MQSLMMNGITCEEALIRRGAPTLAGLKTGSLFPCAYVGEEELRRELSDLNRLLRGKGLRLLPLKREPGRVLLYLYRPARLSADLSRMEARELLYRSGHKDLRPAFCLMEICRRLRAGQSFPHEIGLFLGYPPRDVRGFMENRGADFKYVGLWKVYHDVPQARATFDLYKACTAQYLLRWQMGASLSGLAVRG